MRFLQRSPILDASIGHESSPTRSSGRQTGTGDDLASSVALLQLAIAAGYTPRNAVQAIGTELEGSAADPFLAIAERLNVGAPMHDALFHDIATLESGLVRLLQVVERADNDGVDVAPHLDAVAADVSRDRLAALDVASHRLSVQLLFPLVFCILPAFLCLSMIPLVLDVLDGLPR